MWHYISLGGYVAMVFISAYIFWLSNVRVIDFYDISSLMFLHETINVFYLLVFVLVYAFTLSLLYWVKRFFDTSFIVSLAVWFSALPFFVLFYNVLTSTSLLLVLVVSFLLSFLIHKIVLDEEEIYKIIPYDAISLKLVKRFLTGVFLLFVLFVVFYSFKGDNMQHISQVIYKIGNVNITNLDALMNNIFENQKRGAMMLANFTLLSMMENVYYDSSLNEADKAKCIKSLKTYTPVVLHKVEEEISKYEETMINANLSQINTVKKAISFMVKFYPLLLGALIYMLFSFLMGVVYVVMYVLVKIYKFAYPNRVYG